MNDASVVIVNLSDGSVAKVLPGIPTARGVVVAGDVGRIFVTSAPNKLVIIDNATLAEISRVDTDLKVFDLGKPGLVTIDTEHPGDASHTVAVDPATHRAFFPLLAGPKGTPVLRIMKPAGT